MHLLLRSARETYPSVVLRTAFEPLDWVTGARLPRPPASLEFELEAPPGFVWPDYLRPNSAIPLWSPAMREALERAGVSNVDYHPARVRNLSTGEVRPYHAANVLGLVAAMDRARSVFEPARRHPVIVRSIEKLVVDEERCRELPLFRLAEYDLLVLVDDRVANALASASLAGVRLEEPSAWDGAAD